MNAIVCVRAFRPCLYAKSHGNKKSEKASDEDLRRSMAVDFLDRSKFCFEMFVQIFGKLVQGLGLITRGAAYAEGVAYCQNSVKQG